VDAMKQKTESSDQVCAYM